MPDQLFKTSFETLTGHKPFLWQEAVYERMMAGDVPEVASIPTGLGKTNVIALWLIALAHGVRLPRRLVYVVNRRTVVDQTTAEIEKYLRSADHLADDHPLCHTLEQLALSTLRGQHADNRAWSADPSKPAVICGTVDMIGSRLLFSGYGVGFKTRPLHAGFLGQDTLLIHDESHLEPAFQKLVASIAAEQRREKHRTGFGMPLRVMELSATVRHSHIEGTSPRTETPFMLSEDDLTHELVGRRVHAVKQLQLHNDRDKLVERLVELALEHESSGSTVLVFARSVKDATNIAECLEKKTKKDDLTRVQSLTGTMRGLERESLIKNDPVFRRFMPSAEEDGVKARSGTVYLVATSAGEVGVNLSADHMVCDLTTFESMAQRLGRVNRFGEPITHIARVDVVHPTDLPSAKAEEDEQKKKSGQQKGQMFYDAARRRTLELLEQLQGDASPAALGRLDLDACAKAYSPPPRMLDTSDILFDNWSMTSITPPLTEAPLPGCPPIAAYLHGITEWEPPRTQVAWRQEVECINTLELQEKYPPAALLADFPLKPHELLQDTTERVYEALGKMFKRLGEDAATHRVWVIDERGAVDCTTLAELCGMEKKAFVRELGDKTLLLPPKAGGLSEQGMLDGKAGQQTGRELGYDVADQWLDADGQPRRCRFTQGTDKEPPKAMRRVARIELPKRNDDEAGTESDAVEYWDWYIRPASAEDAGSRWSRSDQPLQEHLDSAEHHAREMVDRLGVAEREAQAVIHAAAWHDLGKDRAVWQASIRNDAYPDKVLAKSKRAMLAVRLSRYRHELGSALDVLDPEGPAAETFAAFDEPTRDLLIHLILAHHGRARPHFPPDECYDPKPGHDAAAHELANETPRRYAHLQRRYGRWYLAYLESLVRAADRMASEPGMENRDAATHPTEASA